MNSKAANNAFERNGKQAVGCVVVRCGNSKPRVAYLLRRTPESKKTLEGGGPTDALADPNSLSSRMSGVEVKRPETGDTGWLRMDDRRAQDIMELKCLDGSTGEVIDPNE